MLKQLILSTRLHVGLKHKGVGGSFMISRETGADPLTSQGQKTKKIINLRLLQKNHNMVKANIFFMSNNSRE